MNATIRRAHEIRRDAAAKFGGRPGDYSMKIACEMAKNGESVMDTLEEGRRIAAAINAKYSIDVRYYDKGVYGSEKYSFAVCKTAKSKKSEVVLAYSDFPALSDVESVARKFDKKTQKELIAELFAYMTQGPAFKISSTSSGKTCFIFNEDVASRAEYLDLQGKFFDFTFEIPARFRNAGEMTTFKMSFGSVYVNEAGEKKVNAYQVSKN